MNIEFKRARLKLITHDEMVCNANLKTFKLLDTNRINVSFD